MVRRQTPSLCTPRRRTKGSLLERQAVSKKTWLMVEQESLFKSAFLGPRQNLSQLTWLGSFDLGHLLSYEPFIFARVCIEFESQYKMR
jgi:hypothetical protein